MVSKEEEVTQSRHQTQQIKQHIIEHNNTTETTCKQRGDSTNSIHY